MDGYRGIGYLRNKLELKRPRVLTRYNYYEMKEWHRIKSPIIPPWLKNMYSATMGWCGRAVDSLSDRLVFDGFAEETDYYGTNQIFQLNNPDVLFSAAILESLIASCAFVQITHGDNGERTPKLSVITADNATGIIDEFTGLLKEGYAVLDRDENKRPILEAWFTPEFTEYYKNGEVYREDNPARYPLLVPVSFRPDSKRPFGHSRISRACMYYQEFARNTLERAEVTAEFYSFPQKYVSGLSPDADPLDAWRATASTFLRFDKDEDGDSPKPGQFSQQSMAPYIDQLKMVAALFAGETGMTLDDLGFASNYPTGDESIKAAHENLRLVARKAQRTYGTAFANVGFVAASVRDDMPYSRTLVSDMKANWLPIFEPDASTISAIGDGAAKVNAAVPGYFGRDNMKTLTGIEPDEPETAVSVTESETVVIE